MNPARRHVQPGRRPRPTALTVLARAAAVVAAALLAAPVLVTAAPASAASNQAADFRIQVRSMSPSAPLPSAEARPFQVVLALTNLTGAPLQHVTITGTRGDPIANRDALSSSLHKPLSSSGLPIKTKDPVTVDLPADDRPHDVVFSTTTGIPFDSGICLCYDSVYPLSFSADYVDSGSVVHHLGTTGTYMPAFEAEPEKVRVSWVWPLIDRPHRLTDDRTFIDDDLASSVGFDGRLYRSLSVLARVASSVPVTVVVDPELLDELQVMTGKYTVQEGKRRVAGQGSAAAGAWLERLRELMQGNPTLTLETTPYGDPDVQSLYAHGLSWRTKMPSALADRVNTALGGKIPETDLVWPASGHLGSRVFSRLVTAGVRKAVLATSAVSPTDGDEGSVPEGLARLSRHGHRIGVGLTDSTIQDYVASVVTRNRPGLAQLPQLMAEIAVRAAQDPTAPHDLVLTPPRYVDADPAVAAKAILDTSVSPFSSPRTLADTLNPDTLPGHVSHLVKFTSSLPTLPGRVMDAATHVSTTLPTVDSLLGGGPGPKKFQISTAASTLLSALPSALQRVESSYWLADRHGGVAFAHRLATQVDGLLDGVHLVPPATASRTYTLASNNSPLPVTVANDLDYPVAVRVKVSTLNGLPGFTARDRGPQEISAHGQSTLKLPTSIARSGRIQIDVQLLTPTQQALGEPVQLSVHSTAFGAVGVVITIVAGVVLVLALLVRWLRWLRRRQRSQREAAASGSSGPPSPGLAAEDGSPGEPAPAAATPAATSTSPSAGPVP